MARRRTPTTPESEQETEAPERAPPPKGHNGPSHDDIRMAANKMVALHEEREQVSLKISKYRKTLKAEGFTLGVLDAMMKMLEWSPEEVKAHFAEREWYAEALRYPVGSQLEFFGTEATPDLVREQLKWRNVGLKNGIAGIGWPDQAPDGCPPECSQPYGEGHEEGAAMTRRAFLNKQRSLAPVDPSDDEDGDDTEHVQPLDGVEGVADSALDAAEAEAEADLDAA